MSAGTLGQFVLYAAFAATGLGQLSEVWGEVSAASGAASGNATSSESCVAIACKRLRC